MNAGVASVALALAAGWACANSALGVGPEQIPRPRPSGGMVDLTGRVSPDTVTALDSLCNEIQKQTGAELAVVVIGSTDGADPHPFATDLFNRWHIGQAGKNNGVLVFVALDDRKAEIILGDGLGDQARIDASREILQTVIVPRFKAGDPGGAVFQGARACAERILGVKLAPLQAEIQDPAGAPSAEPVPPTVQAPPAPPVLPAARQAPPAAQAVPPAAQAVPPAAWQGIKPAARRMENGVVIWPLLGLGGAGLAGGMIFGARKFRRYRTRRCPGCRGDMTRLGEAADDEYLTQGERIEERVGSVDYDVWACGMCRETLKFRYGALFTRFSRCPQCRAQTKNSTTRTVRAATYSQGGLVEVEESCRNCSYRNSRTHSTPMLTDTTAASAAIWSSGSAAGFSGGPSTSFDAGISSPPPSFDAGVSSPPPSFDTGVSGGHSSGAGASGGW
ncbi:MAG TPA: TPM domain-containing protein [Pirellulales bacterium]|nr:TPM domain-containing protein [Pirellulales bacterium]